MYPYNCGPSAVSLRTHGTLIAVGFVPPQNSWYLYNNGILNINAGKTNDMKEKHIPIAVDSIPNERNPNSQCPYPINESISPIAPPSHESTINPKKDQGPGYINTIIL